MIRTALLVILMMIVSSLLISAAHNPIADFGVPEMDPDLTGIVVKDGFAKVSTNQKGMYLSAQPLTVMNKSNSFNVAKVSKDVVNQVYFKPCKSCSNWYVITLSTVAVPQPGKCQWRYTYNP